MRLIYHANDGTNSESPFDREIVSIAKKSSLRIACPYVSLSYLERITDLATSWKLLTDIEELLSLVMPSERNRAAFFICENDQYIRHIPKLHSKVVIGNSAALIGSANLTVEGIFHRTEMAVSISANETLQELAKWFDCLWEKGTAPPYLGKLQEIARNLPPPRLNTQQVLDSTFPEVDSSESPIYPWDRGGGKLLKFQGTTFTAYGHHNKSGGFTVLKDSTARFEEADGFGEKYQINYYNTRQSLVNNRSFLNCNDYNYKITRDVTFESASEAASVVFGGSRSGNEKWTPIV